MDCKKIVYIAAIFYLSSCAISYKFSGTSIDYTKISSVSIADFPNNAPLVNPSLSNNFSEGLRDIFQRQTRLQLLRAGGNLELEGYIKGYSITNMAVAADSYASETKLTLTVHVIYTNNIAPEESFEKDYSAYQMFDATRMLEDVQDELCSTMIQEITESIFNDTVAKW